MKKHYYSIGEVCNLLDLKPHTLRYWEEEFSQIRPKKEGGRNRKYSITDIELIKRIAYLLHTEKYTLKGAKKALKRVKKGEQMRVKLPVDGAKEQISSLLDEINEILAE